MQSSRDDVKVAKASDFTETGAKGAKSKHAVVEVVENKTGKHYFDKPEKYQWVAQAEVIAQEINRASYPNNPVTMYKQDKDGIHVLSERVEGFKSLHQLIQEHGGRTGVIEKINRGEYKNFGTCVVLALQSNEADLHNGNIGIDKNNNFIKIDADWSNARVRYGDVPDRKFNITNQVIKNFPMLNTKDFNPYNWFDQVKEGNTVPVVDAKLVNSVGLGDRVKEEINAQQLRSMLLPSDCIKTIVNANTIDKGEAKVQLDEHLKSRLQMVKSACVDPSFRAYMESGKGKKVMEDYVKQLQAHQLTNGQSLGDSKQISKNVNDIYGQVQVLANTSRKRPEVWIEKYNKFIASATNNSQEEYAKQLFLAIDSHDKETTYTIIKSRPDSIEQKNENDRTPLLNAARRKFHGGFTALRDAKADMTATDMNNDNALALAARSGSKKIAEDMIASKTVDINSVNKQGKTPAMHAAENGKVKVLDTLVKNGADLSKKDAKGNTAFTTAIEKNKLNCLEIMLKEGNHNSQAARDALTIAVENDKTAAARVLLNNKVNPNITSGTMPGKDYTPLMSAIANKNDELMVAILKESNKGGINYKAADGTSAFTKAYEHDNKNAIMTLLQDKRFDITPYKDALNDLLMDACAMGKSDLAAALIDKGANVNYVDPKNNNETPLMIAARNGDDKMVDMILAQKGFNSLSAKNKDHESAAALALVNGNDALCNRLVALDKSQKKAVEKEKAPATKSSTSKLAMMFAGGSKDNAKSNLQKKQEPPKKTQQPSAESAASVSPTTSLDPKALAAYAPSNSTATTTSEETNVTTTGFRRK